MTSCTGDPAIERLDQAECWRLLGSRSFGRLCFEVDDRVELVLSPYVAGTDRVFFRVPAFGPVARRVRTRPVTLQVDDAHGEQPGWTVTLTGLAHHVDDPATLASLWSPVRPVSWEIGQEPLWMALVADDVQGQRLRV